MLFFRVAMQACPKILLGYYNKSKIELYTIHY